MAKKYQHIDDLFKEVQIQEDVQMPAFIKSKIDQELFKPKKYRFLLFFLPLLLVGGAAAFFYGQNSNNSIEENAFASIDQTDLNNTNTINTQKTKIIRGTASSKDLNIEDLELRTNSVTDLKGNATSNQKQTSQLNSSIKTNTSTKHSSGAAITTSGTKTITTVPNPKSIAQSTTKTEKGSSPKGNTPNGLLADDEPDDSVIPSNDTDNTLASSNPNQVKTDQIDDLNKADTTTTTKDTVTQKDPSQQADQDTTFTPAPSNNVSPRLPKNPNPWFIGLTSGMNIQNSKFITENATDELLYRDGIKDKWGFETNLDISYRLKSGLKFGTGLGYRNSFETYDFSKEYYRYDTIYTAMFLRDTSAYIYDTLRGKEVDSTLMNHVAGGVNKVSYLSIPVQIGTQFIFDKFRLDLFAELRWNLLLNSQGSYYAEGKLLTYEGKDNDFYKSSYFDMTLGVSSHYKLYKNLYFSGTIRFRPGITPTRIDLPFEKRLYYTHVGIGLSLAL